MLEEEDGQGGGNGDGGGGGDVGRGDSPIPIPMLLPTAVPIRIAIPMEPGGPGVGEGLTHGTLMEHSYGTLIWNTHMEHSYGTIIWNTNGTLMEHLWNTYGTLMEHSRNILLMEHLVYRVIRGAPRHGVAQGLGTPPHPPHSMPWRGAVVAHQ